MSEDHAKVAGWYNTLSGLLDLVGPASKPGQVEEVRSCPGAGEWQLSLEFLTDFILYEDVKVSPETFATIAELAEDLRTDRGIDSIRDELVEGD